VAIGDLRRLLIVIRRHLHMTGVCPVDSIVAQRRLLPRRRTPRNDRHPLVPTEAKRSGGISCDFDEFQLANVNAQVPHVKWSRRLSPRSLRSALLRSGRAC